MVWYVNNVGPISSINACPQIGKCERQLQDDDPELVTYLKKCSDMIHGVKTVEQMVDEQMNSPMMIAIISALAAPEYAQKIRESLQKYYEALKSTQLRR